MKIQFRLNHIENKLALIKKDIDKLKNEQAFLKEILSKYPDVSIYNYSNSYANFICPIKYAAQMTDCLVSSSHGYGLYVSLCFQNDKSVFYLKSFSEKKGFNTKLIPLEFDCLLNKYVIKNIMDIEKVFKGKITDSIYKKMLSEMVNYLSINSDKIFKDAIIPEYIKKLVAIS